MMLTVLVISCAIAFLTVLLGTPFAEKYLSASGIVGRDQQKEGRPQLPTSGGLIVILGFLVAITFFSGSLSLFTDFGLDRALLFAALSTASLIALIGLVDDINVDLSAVLGEEVEREIYITENRTFIHEKTDLIFGEESEAIDRAGLSQISKLLMVVPASFPLIAVGAGSWTMSFPLVGTVNWGLFYPLVLLPLGLIFVSNAINILAGMNGLETGLSLILSVFLGVFAYQNGVIEASAILFTFAAALLAFLYYNWYPATILPGDSLTYLSGAVIFSAVVIGDMEKFAIVLFLPWILELALKLRSGLNAHSWGELQPDGSLKPLYDKNYSLTHVFMRRGMTEKQVSLSIMLLVFIWCAICFTVFSYFGL